MDESEIKVEAHGLVGARRFIEELVVGQAGRAEGVVDAYLRLVRGGMGVSPAAQRRG